MRPTARQRWIGYGLAGLATLAAIGWLGEPSDADGELGVIAAPARAAPAEPAQQVGRLAALEPQQRVFPAGGVDLFSTPAWQRPPAPRPQSIERPAATARERRPPPLPFTYLGRWVEGGVTQVYVTADGKDYRAAVGGKLRGDYRIKSIDQRELVLEYLPLRALQVLPLQAAAAPAHARGPTPRGNGGDDATGEPSEGN